MVEEGGDIDSEGVDVAEHWVGSFVYGSSIAGEVCNLRLVDREMDG
jgi:hypothetical protein